MAEDRIELILDIKARGASGVTSEVKKLEGTFKDVEDELKRLTDVGSGFGNLTRKQIKQLADALVLLKKEADSAGRSLGLVEGRNIGTKKAKLIVGTDDLGDELKRKRKTLQEEIALGNLFIKDMKRQDAEKLAQEKEYNRESITLAKERVRQIKEAERERIANEKAIQKEIDDNQRNFERKVAAGDKAAARDAAAGDKASKLQAGAIAATVGFIGINIADSIGKSLDSVKIGGVLAPKVKEIATEIGSIFGSTFGDILGNIASGLTSIAESLFDSVFAILRTGLKFVAGAAKSIFIALIASAAGGPLGIAIGAVLGFVQGVIDAFNSLLSSVVDIVKNLLGGITALISAGLKIIGSIFEGIISFITGIWKAFWEGLKSAAAFSMQAIEQIVSVVLDQLSKGFADFVETEKLATKSFDNIADQADKFGGFQSGIKQIDTLSDSLREQFGVTAQAAESAIYDTLSGKFKDLGEATQVLTAAGKLHVATQADIATTTSVLNTILIAYGKSAEDADKISQELYSTARLGRTDMTRLAESIGPAAVAASQAGVSFEEFSAAVSLATLSGLTASQAEIGLQRVLSAINDPTKKNADTFKEYGVAIRNADGSTRDFFDIITDLANASPDKLRGLFGPIQAVRFFRAIKDNIPLLNQFKETIGGDNTTFAKAFEASTKQFFFMLDVLTQIGQVIRKNIAGGLAEVFRKPLEAAVPLLREISDLLSSDKAARFFKGFQDFAQPIVDVILRPLFMLMDDIIKLFKEGDFDSFFKSEGAKEVQNAIINIINFLYDIPGILIRATGLFDNLGSIISTIYKTAVVPMIKYLSDTEAVQHLIDGITDFGSKLIEIKDTVIAHLFDPNLMRADLKALFGFLSDAISAIGKFLLDELVLAFNIAADYFTSVVGARLKEVITTFLAEAVLSVAKVIGKGAASLSKSSDNASEIGVKLALAQGAKTLADIRDVFSGASASLNPDTEDRNARDREDFAGRREDIVSAFHNSNREGFSSQQTPFGGGRLEEDKQQFSAFLFDALKSREGGGKDINSFEVFNDALKEASRELRILKEETSATDRFNSDIDTFGTKTRQNASILSDKLGAGTERFLGALPKTEAIPVVVVSPDNGLEPPPDPTPILREQLATLKAINDTVKQSHPPAHVISGPAIFRSPTIDGP